MTRQQKLVEKLAACEHNRWSDWQKFLHSRLYELNGEDTPKEVKLFLQANSRNYHLKVLPTELYERWERQIATPYCDLSKAEQQSNIKEVTRYFPYFVSHIEGLVSEYMKALDGLELPEEVWKKIADVNGEYLLENIPLSTQQP